MVVRTRTRALAGAFALSLGALLAPCSQAHEHDEAAYSISSPNTAVAGYVISDTALIRILQSRKGVSDPLHLAQGRKRQPR
jgi:hypothetical protein